MIHSNSLQASTSFHPLEAALRDQFEQYPRSHWYVLVDAAQVPDLAKARRQGALRNVPYVSLFGATVSAAEQSEIGNDAVPYLFSLDHEYAQEKAIAYTVQKAINTHAVSWLVSPLTLPELAKRLAARTEAKLSPDMQVLLRFYDTRVLPNVLSVMTPEQATKFISLAQSWWYVDREGKLRSSECRFAPDDTFCAPIKFSQEQEDKLIELSFPDTVLSHLSQNQSDLMTTMDRAQQHAFVVRQIARVHSLKLDSLSAILTCCVLALVKGEAYMERLSSQDKLDAFITGVVPTGETTA